MKRLLAALIGVALCALPAAAQIYVPTPLADPAEIKALAKALGKPMTPDEILEAAIVQEIEQGRVTVYYRGAAYRKYEGKWIPITPIGFETAIGISGPLTCAQIKAMLPYTVKSGTVKDVWNTPLPSPPAGYEHGYVLRDFKTTHVLSPPTCPCCDKAKRPKGAKR